MNSLDYNSLIYPIYESNDSYGQAVKKAKIGHLGLLAQTCLRYSYEFNLIIKSADTYSSIYARTLNSDDDNYSLKKKSKKVWLDNSLLIK